MERVKRKISKEIYLSAAFYTIIMLIVGFIAGMAYDRYWEDRIREDISLLSDLSFTSEILYALEGSEEFCEVYPYTIKRVEEETWRIGVMIDELEKENRLPQSIKMRYFDMELRDYFLTKRAYKECNISSVSILYFYTNDPDKCLECYSEGFELTIARNKLKEKNYTIKLYAFDGEAEHEIVQYLKSKYGIDRYPTLVIIYKNSSLKIEGFSEAKDIIEKIEKIK